MAEFPSRDKIEGAFDAALSKTNDLMKIDDSVLDELGIPHDAEKDLLLHVNHVVHELISARGLLKTAIGHRPADPSIAEEASKAGYAAAVALPEQERKRIEESVFALEYRSMNEGEKIGAEGQSLSRKMRPDLPENHAWHRYFSYGFWGALRPQDGPFADGQTAGGAYAVKLWKYDRARVEEACAGMVGHSDAEFQALQRFAENVAVKELPEQSRDRDWLAGWKSGFWGTWETLKQRGF